MTTESTNTAAPTKKFQFYLSFSGVVEIDAPDEAWARMVLARHIENATDAVDISTMPDGTKVELFAIIPLVDANEAELVPGDDEIVGAHRTGDEDDEDDDEEPEDTRSTTAALTQQDMCVLVGTVYEDFFNPAIEQTGFTTDKALLDEEVATILMDEPGQITALSPVFNLPGIRYAGPDWTQPRNMGQLMGFLTWDHERGDGEVILLPTFTPEFMTGVDQLDAIDDWSGLLHREYDAMMKQQEQEFLATIAARDEREKRQRPH